MFFEQAPAQLGAGYDLAGPPMITDPIFYRQFESSPETFFIMLGMSLDAAKERASHYQYEALEFKETAHRSDGVFLPKEPGLPVYFLEVQFYPLPSVFADLLVKAYTYLKQHDPSQAYRGVVLFGSRNLEPKDLTLYQPLLDAGLVQCFYLDTLPRMTGAPLGVAILHLIGESESEARVTARELVARTKAEIQDDALQADLLELIATVILYKLPGMSREEIQAMLQVHSLRETRVYQELKEELTEEIKQEVRQEVKQEVRQEVKQEILAEERQRSLHDKLDALGQLAAMKIPASKIAAILKLDLDFVRRRLAESDS